MSDQSSWTPTEPPGAPFGAAPPEQPSWATPSASDAPATYGGTPTASPYQPASPSPYAPTPTTSPYAPPAAGSTYGPPPTSPPYGSPPVGSPYASPPVGSPYASPPAGSPYGQPPTTSPYGPPASTGGGAGSSYPSTPYPLAPGYGPGPYGPVYPPAAGTDGVSIAALVTGLLGLGVIPLILGIVGLNRVKKTGRSGRGMAIAGVVLGSLTIVAWLGLAALVSSPAFQDGWRQGTLRSACERGDMAACDNLYRASEQGSEDWDFADTCGGRTDGGFSCVLLGAETYGDNADLDELWDGCAAGDGQACEDLYLYAPPGTDYETFGATCGRLTDGTVDCTEALAATTG